MLVEMSWKFSGNKNSIFLALSCKGWRSAVAITCFLGMSLVGVTGLGLMMCMLVDAQPAVGVRLEGRDVVKGAGDAFVPDSRFMTIGRTKSYAAT